MPIIKASCENCGGILEQIDDINYRCENCESLYVLKDDVLVVKNINNVTNNYYGASATARISEEKFNGYFDLIVEDIISGDLSSARDYCLRILNKNPQDKLIAKIKSKIDGLKQPNGRYKKLEDFYEVCYFTEDFFSDEKIYNNDKTLEFCERLFTSYQGTCCSIETATHLYNRVYSLRQKEKTNRYDRLIQILHSKIVSINIEDKLREEERQKEVIKKIIGISVGIILFAIITIVICLNNSRVR